jgi:acetyl esterase/lipase
LKARPEEHFPRFTLEDTEHVCVIASYVAAGRSQEINLLPNQRQSWFLSFAQSLSGDSDEAVNAIFSMLQHVLMAQRSRDFLSIQLEPAFSAFARTNALALAKAARLGSSALSAEWQRVFTPGWEETAPEQVITTYTGGPGDSPGNAITILAPELTTAIHGEYWYLFYVHGRNWQLGEENRTAPDGNGRVFDQLEVIFPDRTREWTYFDVTRLITPSFQED